MSHTCHGGLGDKKTSKAGKRKLPGGMEENGKAKRPKAAQLTLDLSPSLQRLLLQNWEQVECHDSVVPLPHCVDVENILQMYLESEQAEQLGTQRSVLYCCVRHRICMCAYVRLCGTHILIFMCLCVYI